MTATLEARKVVKAFKSGAIRKKTTLAVDRLSLEVSDDPPSILAIAGESGSGKTTLAQLLLGMIDPTEGEIRYKGRSLNEMTRGEWVTYRREVQAIFQDPFGHFNPFYKIDHVLHTPVKKFKLADSRVEGRRLVENALTDVGLRPDETLGRYPHQLSGGQRQRVMVARALLIRPRIIIADEPVSMVDASMRATILETLRRLNADHGISIVYITHDLTTAYQLAENIVIMYGGEAVEAGNVEQVIKQAQHPYSRLLIGSIPRPDPEIRWGVDADEADRPAVGMLGNGCRFYNRCPQRMEKCLELSPPLYRTSDRQAVGCHLYEDSPPLPRGSMSEVVRNPDQPIGAHPPQGEF